MRRSQWPVLAAAALLGSTTLATAQNIEPLDLECGAAADDSEPAPRAKEHADRARALYDDGDYEHAIREFKASYCLVPSDVAAYNIGTSYLNLVDYEHALMWFEQFVRIATVDNPKRKSTANRIDRLRNYPAFLTVSTDPPGATVTLTSEASGEPIVGKANDNEPLQALAGRYTMTVTLAGHETETKVVDLRIGRPYTFSFRLAEKRGTVRITTEPLSARIFVDDKLVAVGSYVDELPLGEHTVTVEAEGRKPATHQLVVEEKGEAKLHVRLPAPPKSGRWELVGAATTVGGISGGAIGNVIFSQGGLGSSAFAFGGLAIGFAGAYFGASEHIPVGHTSYIIGGSFFGAGEGLGLGLLLAPTDDDAIAAFTVTGIAAGVLTASLTASRFDLTAGDAAILNSGALWGSITSALLLSTFDVDEQVAGAFLLAGLNFGLLAGGAVAARTEYSRGHVALIDVSGFGGMILALAVAPAFIDDSSDAGTSDTQQHFVLGGAGVGLILGSLLTRKMDQEKPQRGFRAGAPTLLLARDISDRPVQLLGVGGVW